MMDMEGIRKAVTDVLAELPAGATLVAAAKTRSVEEVLAAVEAGVRVVGHNYVQEAERMAPAVAGVQWHMIGHVQRNKAARTAGLFDMVETVDSLALAKALDRHAAVAGKTLPVLIEINSAGEESKGGVLPEDAEGLVREAAVLSNLSVEGLMTMGPFVEDPELARPSFRLTRELFEHLAAASIPGARMKTLSMGMSSSYGAALEEGANMVRVGTRLFGERPPLKEVRR